MYRYIFGIAVFTMNFFWVFVSSAQMIHSTTPLQRNGSSFSESIGTNWGLSGKNWFVNVGGNRLQNQPQFGDFDINSGMHGGFQFQKGGTSGYFNGWAGQSYNGYSSVEAPSVTFMNGQYASFQDVTETPFVYGFVPVVGSYGSRYYTPTVIPNDPTTRLSTSVLDQKIERLNLEKKPRYVREPNAPALKEIQQKPRKTREKKTASKKSEPSSESRFSNSHTADSPALSVAEMKRRYKAKKKEE